MKNKNQNKLRIILEIKSYAPILVIISRPQIVSGMGNPIPIPPSKNSYSDMDGNVKLGYALSVPLSFLYYTNDHEPIRLYKMSI